MGKTSLLSVFSGVKREWIHWIWGPTQALPMYQAWLSAILEGFSSPILLTKATQPFWGPPYRKQREGKTIRPWMTGNYHRQANPWGPGWDSPECSWATGRTHPTHLRKWEDRDGCVGPPGHNCSHCAIPHPAQGRHCRQTHLSIFSPLSAFILLSQPLSSEGKWKE